MQSLPDVIGRNRIVRRKSFDQITAVLLNSGTGKFIQFESVNRHFSESLRYQSAMAFAVSCIKNSCVQGKKKLRSARP